MRHKALTSILLALLALASACKSSPHPAPSPGRSDSASPVTASQPPASAVQSADSDAAPAAADAPDSALAHDPRPVLVCFGDSLTAGFGTDPGQSYPDFLQRDLNQAGYKYRVVNEGVSGNTTKDGVERLTQVLSIHPAIVVVEFGGNDGLRGLRIQDTRANLDHIVAALTVSGGPHVAIAGITLPPDYGPDYIREFNAIYPDLARRYHVPYLPFLLQGVFGNEGMMQADRTHATAQGNEVVADNVLHLIRPLLKR